MLDRDEVRDLLPDLLHGRLAPAEAARVRAAMDADASLAAEYAMLQAARPALASAPTLDLAAIVAALPAPPVRAAGGAPEEMDDVTRRRLAKGAPARRWAGWPVLRAAAVLAVLAGGSIAVVRGRSVPRGSTGVDTTLVAATGAVQLDLGAAVDGLSEAQLQALEAEIRQMDGLPSAEPDAGLDEGA